MVLEACIKFSGCNPTLGTARSQLEKFPMNIYFKNVKSKITFIPCDTSSLPHDFLEILNVVKISNFILFVVDSSCLIDQV